MRNEIGRRILDKLIEIYRSDNFTVAFLPYKRSMWNSMESVHEECIHYGIRSYCLPLPYYRMKANNEIDYVACDKDFFEYGQDISLLDEVPVDFVVIHYPYDGNNRVTRMLPEYHTDQLRKYGKVVYIPYTCTSGRQFRVQPGIANIDYAFLPNENDANDFIAEWKELGVDFTGRVFGLGSPKMDAMAKAIKTKHTKQKTTLIISSLAPFLYEPFIRMNRYKTAVSEELDAGHRVIFRPHPLLKQTIKSMRPDTMDEYNKLIEWIQSVGAVVDQTEYLEEALASADFLVSDPSSVLEMWISTGREFKII